jgi:hypothetical protein
MKVPVKPRTSAFLSIVLMTALAAGCAAPGGDPMTPEQTPAGTPSAGGSAAPSPDPTGSATGKPPMSEIPPPTLRPPDPKQSAPTDLIPADTISGRVTKGGSGPCYGLVTDDDVAYALHSTAGITLEEGTYVRAKIAPLGLKISCGQGRHMALISATKL